MVANQRTLNGQLYSGLAALEKWLCMLVDAGTDVNAQIQTILRDCDSVATLGVLVNLGKYRPKLLEGPLQPLLTEERLYRWDETRVAEAQQGSMGYVGEKWHILFRDGA